MEVKDIFQFHRHTKVNKINKDKKVFYYLFLQVSHFQICRHHLVLIFKHFIDKVDLNSLSFPEKN